MKKAIFTLIAILLPLTPLIVNSATSPNKKSTKHQFTVNLPADWIEIPPDTIAKQLSKVATSANKVSYQYGYQKASDVPFTPPYILIGVKDGKYTQQKINNLIAQLPTTRMPDNYIKDAVAIRDYKMFKPYYDATSHIIWWVMDTEANGNDIKSLNALVLTNKNALLINCYTTSETYNDVRHIFEDFIRSIEVDGAIKYKTSLLDM